MRRKRWGLTKKSKIADPVACGFRALLGERSAIVRARRMLNRAVPLFFVAVFAFAWGTKGASGQSTTAEAWPTTGQAVPGDGTSGDGPSRNEGFISSFSTSFPAPCAEPWKEPSPPPLMAGLPAAPSTSPTPGETRHDEDHGPGPLGQALGHEPLWGLQTFVSYDTWKGISDGGWQNNGINVGANFGMCLGEWGRQTGVGFQIGGSEMVADWSGTDYGSVVETQGFITYGLFRRPTETTGWTAGLVQDWMLNDHFGEYAQDPTLSQLRGQLGYAWSATNEIGLSGAVRLLGGTRDVSGVGTTTWRPIDQLNLYWHHKWSFGADTTIWVGIPEQDQLGGSGSLGEYIAGASANVPLNHRWSLFTLITYMHPSSRPSMDGSEEEAWNFTIGVSLTWGRETCSETVAGHAWMPLMPLANNGYFFVDTNRH
jgi:hypothetical protein